MGFSFIDSAKLLTAEEVAERLRVKPATIYQAAADGRIPSIRLWEGTRRALIRFDAAEIDRLLEARSVRGDGFDARSRARRRGHGDVDA